MQDHPSFSPVPPARPGSKFTERAGARLSAEVLLLLILLGVHPAVGGPFQENLPAWGEHDEEKAVLGEIVAISLEDSRVQIRDEQGQVLELGVDPYATIIWKAGGYAEDVSALAVGDRAEAAYFSGEGGWVAGWIDVLDK
ncbi:MAG: hypothetical protein HYY14_00855 [Candidatus Omnitrophica bacterium]|nr:hypothetical protein [Candidatus Omnitrophota bacterium]